MKPAARISAMQTFLAPLLAILSFLYSFVMRVRAWFYHVGVLPSDTCGAFVVSIGNLQAGGTGKTPAADFFARRWREFARLGIVSRGYGRETTGSLRVDGFAVNAAAQFGDEPAWLAKSLTGVSGSTAASQVVISTGPVAASVTVPVQVGERRIEAARDLIAAEGVKLVLLDDGFQHLALRRSFDIVLVDVSAPRWHWRVLPWGRLREPVSALHRSDAVILTKTESVSEERLVEIERQILRWARAERRFFDGVARKLPLLRFRQVLSWSHARDGESLLLAAGLANPQAFFEMVRSDATKPNIVGEVAFPDHYVFTDKDVRDLKRKAQEARASRVLVTEKDAVKLQPFWSTVRMSETKSLEIELVVSKLEVRPVRESDEKQLEQIDEIILRQVRGNSGPRGKLSSRQPSA